MREQTTRFQMRLHTLVHTHLQLHEAKGSHDALHKVECPPDLVRQLLWQAEDVAIVLQPPDQRTLLARA